MTRSFCVALPINCPLSVNFLTCTSISDRMVQILFVLFWGWSCSVWQDCTTNPSSVALILFPVKDQDFQVVNSVIAYNHPLYTHPDMPDKYRRYLLSILKVPNGYNPISFRVYCSSTSLLAISRGVCGRPTFSAKMKFPYSFGDPIL